MKSFLRERYLKALITIYKTVLLSVFFREFGVTHFFIKPNHLKYN